MSTDLNYGSMTITTQVEIGEIKSAPAESWIMDDYVATAIEYFVRRAFDKHIGYSHLFIKTTSNLKGVRGITGAWLRATPDMIGCHINTSLTNWLLTFGR